MIYKNEAICMSQTDDIQEWSYLYEPDSRYTGYQLDKHICASLVTIYFFRNNK